MMKRTSTIVGLTMLGAAAAYAGWGDCSGSKMAANDNTCAATCSGGEEMVAQVVNADHHNMGSSQTIVEIAAGNDQFSTLVAAVKAAGLAETLSGDGPFTVFAPTNDAFAKLPAGTVETLLKPENKEMLKSILTYHVVSGEVMAEDVVNLREATTVNGQRIDIAVEKDSAGNPIGVDVDKANVVSTDIDASNGVIHVIDTVIIPVQENAVQVAQAAGQFQTLLTAAQHAGLAETLSTTGPITIFAPTDEAFSKLPRGTVQSLLRPENRDKLASILKYHVVEGRVYDDQAVKLDNATTLQGDNLRISIVDGRLTINDASVVKSDIEASNAVIHVIDEVLLPE